MPRLSEATPESSSVAVLASSRRSLLAMALAPEYPPLARWISLVQADKPVRQARTKRSAEIDAEKAGTGSIVGQLVAVESSAKPVKDNSLRDGREVNVSKKKRPSFKCYLALTNIIICGTRQH